MNKIGYNIHSSHLANVHYKEYFSHVKKNLSLLFCLQTNTILIPFSNFNAITKYLCFSDCHHGKPAFHLPDDSLYKTSDAIDLMLSCPEENTLRQNELIANVSCNSVFVCQATTHKRRLDLRRDNMGMWVEGHRKTRLPYKDSVSVAEERANSFVWRTTFTCKSCKELKKNEIYRRERLPDGSVGDIISPMVIVYQFKGKPVTFKVIPHGNSKTLKPFHPATRTLLGELHDEVSRTDAAPSKIYNKVNGNGHFDELT